jgi:hypothetical protein
VGIGTTTPTAPVDTNGVRLGRNWAIANRANIRLDSSGSSYPADILFGHTAAANQTSWDGVYWSISSRAAENNNLFTIWRGAGNPGGSGEAIVFSIKPDGNVGIGTTTPSQKLDVAGQAAIGSGAQAIVGTDGTYGGYATTGFGGTTNGYNRVFGNAGTADGLYLASATGQGIAFWTNGANTTRMFITSGGDVGIGTTSPSTALHIARAAAVSPTLRLQTTDSTTNGSIQWSNSTNSVLAFIGSNANISDGSGNLEFATGGTSTKMVLTSAGNLGIGIAAPNNLLNTFISNGAGAFSKGIRIGTGDGSYTSGHGGMLEFQNEDVMTAGIRGVRQSGWGSSLLFYVHNTSAGNTFNSTFVERMRIAEDGNVGIGTSDPTAQMSGTFGIGMYHATLPAIGFKNNTTSWLWYADGTTLKMWNASAGDILIGTSSGRIGIGTTNPSTKLQVSGGDGIINNAFIGEVPTYTSANAQFSHTSRAVAGEYSFLSANDGETFINSKTGYNIRFRVNNNDKVIINSAGNVGIGTTSPGYKLDVQSGSVNFRYDQPSSTSYTYFRNWASGGSVALLLGTNTDDDTSAEIGLSSNVLYLQAYGDPGSSIQFGTRNSSTSAVRMTINQDGNVGIGTSSPATKLDLTGTLGFTVGSASGIIRRTTVNGSNGIVIQGNANDTINDTNAGASIYVGGGTLTDTYEGNIDFTAYGAIVDANRNQIRFFNRSGVNTVTERMRINHLGNVGIGTASPGYKLDVSGVTSTQGLYIPGLYTFGQSQSGIEMQLTSTSYNAIRFYQGTDYTGVIHSFGRSWGGGASVGMVNIEGYNGVTIGAWNIPTATFLSSGNVGIGTTNPTWKLTILGNNDIFNVTSQTADTSLPTKTLAAFNGIYNSGGNGHNLYISSTAGTGPWEFNTTKTWGGFMSWGVSSNGTSITRHMSLTDAGNVGIGTTAPGTPLGGAMGLVIDGNANGDVQIRIQANSTGRTSTDGGLLSISGTAMYLWNYENDALYFGTNNTTRVTITSGGNVGIGTSSPGSYKLYVNGGQFGTLLKGGDLGTGSDVVRMSKSDDSVAMLVRGDGRVGINTSSPTQLLHVNDGNAIIQTAYIGNISAFGTSYASFSHIERTGSGDYSFLSDNSGITYINAKTSNSIRFRINNLDKVIINDAGDVGIGTTTPGAKLQVSGAISASSINFGQETLNVYDADDTWIPEINTSNNDMAVINYAVQEGTYTRIGDVVHAWFYIDVSSIANAGTGTAIITSLPYTSGAQVTRFSSVITTDASLITVGTAGTQLKGYVAASSNDITLSLDDSGVNGFGFARNTAWKTGGGVISGYVVYKSQ